LERDGEKWLHPKGVVVVALANKAQELQPPMRHHRGMAQGAATVLAAQARVREREQHVGVKRREGENYCGPDGVKGKRWGM
jgi:hypothetical protein